MRGVVFLGERELELREFPDPRPGPGEVVLAMKASGMCGSDLHPYRASRSGSAAKSLGLGGDGRAVHRGPRAVRRRGRAGRRGPGGRTRRPGARVMCHHYKGCGHCKHCRAGWAQLCRRGIVVYGMTGHGGHAPYMVVPASTLVPLPEELSFEEGAAVSCGTGTAYQALRGWTSPGGTRWRSSARGRWGLRRRCSGWRWARVSSRSTSAASGASSGRQLGADAVIDPGATDVVAALKGLTDGEGVDAALDCTGHPDARLAAVRATRTWGRVGLVGEGSQVTFDVSPDLLRRQLTIHASWTFSTLIQEECARFIVKRAVPLKRLLTHRFRLAEAADAYRLFDTQTTGKGVFVFD